MDRAANTPPGRNQMGKVSRISAQTLRLALGSPLTTSKRAYPFLEFVIVRIESDDGSVGWGEAHECVHITGETQVGILDAINNRLGPAITGIEPGDLEEAHRRMNAVMSRNTAAKSAVDIALHDLAGTMSSLPVSRLLGGGPRGPVASSKAVSVGATEAMVDEARTFVEDGFGTLKIKTGVDDSEELAAIAAIREMAGPAVHIKLDANQGWNLQQARRFLAAAERYDIQMVEQPLPAWDYSGHAELRRNTSIPVMMDESVHSPRDALRAIETGAADLINIKLVKTGGLAPARDLAAICAAAGMSCQIGTLDTSIGSAAALHLVHACPTIRFAEINGPTRLEKDVATGFAVENGNAILQAGPGLGIDVDTSALSSGNG